MEEYIIETINLTKKFSSKVAVNSVNLHIKKGDIYGFIGRNGAGKTTAMKVVLGLLFPTSGEIKIFGSNDLNKGRRKIGSLIENPGLYKNCTAYENMKRFSLLYGGTDEDIHSILSLVGLDNTGKMKAGKFSLGMKQRLGIGIALLGNPEILVLDEPVNGLDPEGIKQVRDIILKLNKEKGVTFFISSHLLDELAKITTTYGIINDGVLVEEVSADELMDRCKQSIKVQVDDAEKAIKVLTENHLLKEYEVDNKYINILNNDYETSLINETLVKNGVHVSSLKSNEGAFEDYFIKRIG